MIGPSLQLEPIASPPQVRISVAADESGVVGTGSLEQLNAARVADVEWRKQHRSDLVQSVARFNRVYSPIVSTLSIAMVWLTGWLIDRACFSGRLMMGSQPGSGFESSAFNPAALFHAVLFVSAILLGLAASNFLRTYWDDRLDEELAMYAATGEERVQPLESIQPTMPEHQLSETPTTTVNDWER